MDLFKNASKARSKVFAFNLPADPASALPHVFLETGVGTGQFSDLGAMSQAWSGAGASKGPCARFFPAISSSDRLRRHSW
jgi:hypothetical protein